MYFESHAHFDDEAFNEDRDGLLASLPHNDVDCVINVGANMETSEKGIALAEKYSFVYAAVGIHPHDACTMKGGDIGRLHEMSKHSKVVAIGEIGLDFHYDASPRDVQADCFVKQLRLAKELDIPVIIHSREACEQTYNIIDQCNYNKGVIHCFSGSAQMALNYVKKGFYIGIGGVVTFKNAKKMVEVVNSIPLENILLETDCPYLAPEPFRGKRNSSLYLKYIAAKIALIKDITVEEVASITYKNASNLFYL